MIPIVSKQKQPHKDLSSSSDCGVAQLFWKMNERKTRKNKKERRVLSKNKKQR
jgi:hypothetical protein